MWEGGLGGDDDEGLVGDAIGLRNRTDSLLHSAGYGPIEENIVG